MAQEVLAFDLGGTKLLGAIVSADGQILRREKRSVDAAAGPRGIVKQIASMVDELKSSHPHIQRAALASAGPLDPVNGLWLNLTNIKSDGKHMGVFPIVQELNQQTALSWQLENDAAAAIRAEVWMGKAKGIDDAVAVTLGTGLGVGVWANGALIRAGRNLHPEGGHLIIEHKEKEVLCGCGNWGCAEAYLSGMNFTKWLSQKWGRTLTGEELVELARKGDARAVSEFKVYSEKLAVFFSNLAVMFCPRKIVISGGFSHSSDLFMSDAIQCLSKLLESRRAGEDLLPEISVSSFQEEAGVLGAAHIALRHH